MAVDDDIGAGEDMSEMPTSIKLRIGPVESSNDDVEQQPLVSIARFSSERLGSWSCELFRMAVLTKPCLQTSTTQRNQGTSSTLVDPSRRSRGCTAPTRSPSAVRVAHQRRPASSVLTICIE
mgnify:CR=1 FL=1